MLESKTSCVASMQMSMGNAANPLFRRAEVIRADPAKISRMNFLGRCFMVKMSSKGGSDFNALEGEHLSAPWTCSSPTTGSTGDSTV